MTNVLRVAAVFVALASLALVCGCQGANDPAGPQPTASTAKADAGPVRCAVIGGLNQTGLWDALSERFKTETGIAVEVTVTGPKDIIGPAFMQGGCDLIAMHSSDTIINLVADGFALNPEPWVKNDLVIVGPAADPAGIRGLTDAAEALRRVADKKATFVVHHSLGAQEVLRAVLAEAKVELDPERTIMRLDERHRAILQFAADQQAYTLVGRIPFQSGKMPNAGLELLVRGDPRLRRPYLVAVANPKKFPDARVDAARRFAGFLRSPATQSFIAEYGRGKFDDQPLFYRVSLEGADDGR